MTEQKEWMIHVWGGAWNHDANPSIEKDYGIKDGYHYSLIYDIHRDAIGYICFANCGLQRHYNRLLWDTQSTDPFDNIIVCIEWLIKEGYFSKEYLV